MLKGKTVVITGANRGIGHAIVERMAEEGADVFACARKETEEFITEMECLAQKYSVDIIPVFFDLMSKDEILRGVQLIKKTKKNIDGLINNAGMVPSRHNFFTMGEDEIEQVLYVNLVRPMELTQYIARLMIRQNKGSIVNFSSIAALDGEPAELEYAISKGGMVSATKNLAIELGHYGVRVNAIAPGLTDTDMGNELDEESACQILQRTILGRKATPTEVANLAVFLVSDLSSYMTGQIIRVDGGMI